MIDSIKQKLAKLNPSDTTNLKKAGVLIGILNYDQYEESPAIIYTQRSSTVSTHSGEVSFPGGMKEKEDKDLYQTALRESHEEINLDPDILPPVAGKTGTAEDTSGGTDHAWFACFAPYDSGEIVIVAFAQNTPGGGSTHALPMAKQILEIWHDIQSNEKLISSND